MEERRTAAWVLGIIALIVIFFAIILPEIRIQSTQTISFKSCVIRYRYWDRNYIPDIDRASRNKLGLCLCNLYHIKPDNSIANRIIQIYRKDGDHVYYDSVKIDNNLDSIIKHKSVVFDTVVLVD